MDDLHPTSAEPSRRGYTSVRNCDRTAAFDPDRGWTPAGFAQLDRLAAELADPDTAPAVWLNLLAFTEQVRALDSRHDYRTGLHYHPITALLHQEPTTAWSFRKPRGYSGDATLIDFLYEHPSVEAELANASPLGRVLHALVASSAAPVAVKERRRLLARLLDATAERVNGAEVLVLACGHLREAELTRSLHRLHRLVALDQDSTSIAEMRRSHSHAIPLVPVEASIGRMIVRPQVHGQFDLIYAAGLYDYLDDTTARRLTEGMFSALKPGGRLLFANFCPGVVDYGYMDAFMDWRLLMRDEAAMQRLVDALPRAEIDRFSIFRGLNRAVIYALVQRR